MRTPAPRGAGVAHRQDVRSAPAKALSKDAAAPDRKRFRPRRPSANVRAMRKILFSIGLALTACGTSSNDDTPALGAGGNGGAASSGAAAGTAGRPAGDAGAGGTSEAGAGDAVEAGEGGSSEFGAAGSTEAGAGGDSGAVNTPGAGNANGGETAGGGAGGTGGAAGTGGTGGNAGAATCPTSLLVGGTDLGSQGWLTQTQGPAAVSYGADYVRLETTTNSGASTSGQLLVYYPAAFVADHAFRVKIEMLVETASPHNQLDSGAAILGSFTTPFGTSTDRSEMVYLDSAALGWSDNSQSAAFPVTDGSYHSYELSVDATGSATFSVDGSAKLTRTGYVSNGTLAIGDQTNDAKVDGALRIRSVIRECL